MKSAGLPILQAWRRGLRCADDTAKLISLPATLKGEGGPVARKLRAKVGCRAEARAKAGLLGEALISKYSSQA